MTFSYKYYEKQRIFIYRVKTMNGVSPNIQGNICSIALSKASIRKSASVGDIIIGLQSLKLESNQSGYVTPLPSPSDRETKLVHPYIDPTAIDKVLFIMQVTKKLPMNMYYDWCAKSCPQKIPTETNSIGDCQYDSKLIQSLYGPHYNKHKVTDLSGKYVLLSENNYHINPSGYHLSSMLRYMWSVDTLTDKDYNIYDIDTIMYDEFIKWITKLHMDYTEPIYIPIMRLLQVK